VGCLHFDGQQIVYILLVGELDVDIFIVFDLDASKKDAEPNPDPLF
jgi:hypothetical protein